MSEFPFKVGDIVLLTMDVYGASFVTRLAVILVERSKAHPDLYDLHCRDLVFGELLGWYARPEDFLFLQLETPAKRTSFPSRRKAQS